MANYAEQLAYWYLRLNGFFLVENYVYHRVPDEHDRTYNADADLLAIRPPYYYEEIPHIERNAQGEMDIFHAPLDADEWLNEFRRKWLGVIVEVKSSDQARVQDIRKSFSSPRLHVVLNRLGMIEFIGDAERQLATNWRYDTPSCSILKLVFSQRDFHGRWKTILLSDADDFIVNRMTCADNYLAKSGSRFFFPSELIQYMIFSSRHRNENR